MNWFPQIYVIDLTWNTKHSVKFTQTQKGWDKIVKKNFYYFTKKTTLCMQFNTITNLKLLI